MTGDQFPFEPTQNLNQRLDIDFALQAAGLGVWELDPTTRQVLWDDRCRALFGLAKHNYLTYEQASQYIHSEDVNRVNQAVQWAMSPESNGFFDETYRTVGADDGQLRWVRFYGRSYFTPAGKLYRFAGVAQEVTDSVQAQQTLRQSEAHYRTLFEAMQDGYTVCEAIRDEQGQLINYRFLQINPAFSRLTGLDATQTLGKTVWEVLPGLDPKWFTFYQQVLDTRQPIRAEEYIPQLGEWYDLTAFWFAEEQFAVLFDETTQRKRQELNLAFLADVSQELVGLTDIDQTMGSLGEKIGRHFGLSRCLFVEIDDAQEVCWVSYGWGQEGAVDIPGRHRIGDFISPQFQLASRAGETVVINDVFADPRTEGEQYAAFQIYAMVTVPLLREGEWYFLLGFYDTKPRQWREDELALMRELTLRIWTRVERARAEAALKESEQRFRLLADALPLAIWVTDSAGNAEFMNKWWATYSGLSFEPISAWQVAVDSLHPEDGPRLVAAFQQAMERGKGFQIEQRNRSASGAYRWFLNVGEPYHDPKTGQITKWVGMGVDIDDRKRAEQALAESESRYRTLAAELEQRVVERTQALQQANQDLTRSNDNLQQFAYVASHDLQEPLRKIQSFSTLLAQQLDEQLTESTRSYLERITAAGARMSMLIKDLLAYSRIATRQQTFGPVSLTAIVEGVLSTLDWEIQQTQARIQVDELPVVNGDESQLGQLFQNLLTNAIKFVAPQQRPLIHIQYVQCPPGDLPAEVRPQVAAPFYHQVNVVDQGVGFELKFRDRIFQVFQRLHGRNEYPGSGVGLAICQRVAENHGGGITARSVPGQGATFSVFLPA